MALKSTVVNTKTKSVTRPIFNVLFIRFPSPFSRVTCLLSYNFYDEYAVYTLKDLLITKMKQVKQIVTGEFLISETCGAHLYVRNIALLRKLQQIVHVTLGYHKDISKQFFICLFLSLHKSKVS